MHIPSISYVLGETDQPNAVVGDGYTLYQGGCLDVMASLREGSVDLCLTDPPYGTTACKWDSVIPFEPMWEGVKRVVKPNAAVALFGSQPFTSTLIVSNLKMFKYAWVWEKERPSNFFQAKFAPLNPFEDIAVFSEGGTNNGTKNPMKYHPQGTSDINVVRGNSNTGGKIGKEHKTSMHDGRKYVATTEGYPKRLIKFGNDAEKTVHPTQKPVALLEYLIKTYTDEGDTVLDFTMGSGSTGVAALNTNRKFIGIELDPGYFDIAVKRIQQA